MEINQFSVSEAAPEGQTVPHILMLGRRRTAFKMEIEEGEITMCRMRFEQD